MKSGEEPGLQLKLTSKLRKKGKPRTRFHNPFSVGYSHRLYDLFKKFFL